MANTLQNKSRERDPQQQQISPRRSYDPFFMGSGEFFSNPFSVMRRMQEEMDRLFTNALGESSGRDEGGMRSWVPAVEVSEHDNQLDVCAELPGLRPEDVKIEVTGDALVIQGERKQENQNQEGGRWHSERRYGRFYRTIPLPEGANIDQAKADFHNGELHVTIPVQETTNQRRQIPINGGTSQSG